jgi:hypothetical protein
MNASTDYCEVCGLPDQQSQNAGSDRVRVTCERCGTFEWRPPAQPWTPMTGDQKVNLSAFIREQNAVGIVPFLQAEGIQQIVRRKRPRLRDRALLALAAIVQEVGYELHKTVTFSNTFQIQAVSYSADQKELSLLLGILQDDGHIVVSGAGSDTVRMTPAGLIQAEELSQSGAQSLQGFVAMSFDSSMNDAYTFGFDEGIRAAGYRAFRIDEKQHINGISDEILAEIRRSRFLVADYTDQKSGVYFEAGVAIGLGIPVIGTCHERDFDKRHFDIKHINTLKWETPAQLATDLAKRISGAIGDGPLLSVGGTAEHRNERSSYALSGRPRTMRGHV